MCFCVLVEIIKYSVKVELICGVVNIWNIGLKRILNNFKLLKFVMLDSNENEMSNIYKSCII